MWLCGCIRFFNFQLEMLLFNGRHAWYLLLMLMLWKCASNIHICYIPFAISFFSLQPVVIYMMLMINYIKIPCVRWRTASDWTQFKWVYELWEEKLIFFTFIINAALQLVVFQHQWKKREVMNGFDDILSKRYLIAVCLMRSRQLSGIRLEIY